MGVGQEVFHAGAQAPEQALQGTVARSQARLQVVGIRSPPAGEYDPSRMCESADAPGPQTVAQLGALTHCTGATDLQQFAMVGIPTPRHH